MNPERAAYIRALLTLYYGLPETAERPALAADRWIAGQLFDQGIPVSTVQTAILLALARRTARQPGLPPLPRIRSLAYFVPVIEELRLNPPGPGYLQYLLSRRLQDQISTDSDER